MTQLASHHATRRVISHPDSQIAALDLKPDFGNRARPSRGTVLFVPGYSGSKEDFAPLLDPLADAGFRAVAIDLPGQYQSDGPDDPTVYTVEWFGAVVRAVARRLRAEDAARYRLQPGETTPLMLIGHSFGGLVCRAAVIDEPELFDTLTLLCSGPGEIGGVRAQIIAQLRPLRAHGKDTIYDELEQLQLKLLPEAAIVARIPSLAAFLRERFLASSLSGMQGMADAITTEPDRTAELARTGVPTLVCHGEADNAWTPQAQAEMAAQLGAEYTVVPGARHSPAIEQTGATLEAVLTFWTAYVGVTATEPINR